MASSSRKEDHRDENATHDVEDGDESQGAANDTSNQGHCENARHDVEKGDESQGAPAPANDTSNQGHCEHARHDVEKVDESQGAANDISNQADNQPESVYSVAFRIFCNVLEKKKGFWSLSTACLSLLVSAWLQIHLLVVILKSISWQLGPSVSDVSSTLYLLSGAPPAPPPLMDGYFYASNKLAVIISRILVLLYIMGVAEDECKFNSSRLQGIQGIAHGSGYLWYVSYVGAYLCPVTQSGIACFAVYVTYAYLNKFDTVGEVVLNGVGISFVLGIDDVIGNKLKDIMPMVSFFDNRTDGAAPTESLSANCLLQNFVYFVYSVLCLYCLCNIADWRHNSYTIAVFILALIGFMFTTTSFIRLSVWVTRKAFPTNP